MLQAGGPSTTCGGWRLAVQQWPSGQVNPSRKDLGLIKQLLAKRRGMGPVDGPEMTKQSSDVHFHRPLR